MMLQAARQFIYSGGVASDFEDEEYRRIGSGNRNADDDLYPMTMSIALLGSTTINVITRHEVHFQICNAHLLAILMYLPNCIHRHRFWMPSAIFHQPRRELSRFVSSGELIAERYT